MMLSFLRFSYPIPSLNTLVSDLSKSSRSRETPKRQENISPTESLTDDKGIVVDFHVYSASVRSLWNQYFNFLISESKKNINIYRIEAYIATQKPFHIIH